MRSRLLPIVGSMYAVFGVCQVGFSADIHRPGFAVGWASFAVLCAIAATVGAMHR